MSNAAIKALPDQASRNRERARLDGYCYDREICGCDPGGCCPCGCHEARGREEYAERVRMAAVGDRDAPRAPCDGTCAGNELGDCSHRF